MALKISTRALQLLSAVALISVLDLIDSTQAYSIGSSSRPSTTMDIGKESSSVHSLSGAKWRAQQLGRRVHGEDKEAIGVSHEQKLVANLESEKRKENSPMSFRSSSMSRSKRDTFNSSSCPLPASLPQKLRQLNSLLNESTYVRVFPQQNGAITLPPDQPQSYPSSKTFRKFRSNMDPRCPYIKVKIDNGHDAYPRYLIQVKCLCTECVGANIYNCHEDRHDVWIFRRKACQNGSAVMGEEAITITMDCFCAFTSVHRKYPLPTFLRQ